MNLVILLDEPEVEIFSSNLPYIKNKIDYENLIIIGNSMLKCKVLECSKDITYLDEDFLMNGLNKNAIKVALRNRCGTDRRAGWYFQQFLKMAYAFNDDNDYMIWDSDTIPAKELNIYDKNGVPYLDYINDVRYMAAYFRTINVLFNNSDANDSVSYITEHMYIVNSIMRKMIIDIENNKNIIGNRFWEKIINAINLFDLNLSGFSEFQTYSYYVLRNYKDKYSLRKWNNIRNGKFYFGNRLSNNMLEWIGLNFDAVSFEAFDIDIKLLPLLCQYLTNKLDFKIIYKIINPIYKKIFEIRMCYRTFKRKNQSKTLLWCKK